MKNIIVSWSGGKDSALALYELLKNEKLRVSALLTTVTEDYDRVSMHGVRRVLLEGQAASLGLPLEIVLISKNASHAEYESKMKVALAKYRDAGTSAVAFGDIFLEDVRKYRQDQLAALEMGGIFPLWKRNALELAHAFTQNDRILALTIRVKVMAAWNPGFRQLPA
jgi:diphthamide synthase (EF-2-diphthine--ammonia ligase)